MHVHLCESDIECVCACVCVCVCALQRAKVSVCEKKGVYVLLIYLESHGCFQKLRLLFCVMGSSFFLLNLIPSCWKDQEEAIIRLG